VTPHPTAGMLRSLLDGELSPSEEERVRAHLQECAECRRALEESQREAELVEHATSAIDPPVDVKGARARLQRRLGEEEDRETGGPESEGRREADRRGTKVPGLGSLARAALLILALAGGVSAALPGSPVRGWLERVWEAIVAPDEAPEPREEEPTEEPDEGEPEEAGIRISPAEGRLRIELIGAESGAQIRLRLIDGPGGGVFAREGTRFETGPGSVVARNPGDRVRVEVPRDADDVEVTVDGRTLFRKVGDGIELPGPRGDTLDSEFHFRLPDGGAG